MQPANPIHIHNKVYLELKDGSWKSKTNAGLYGDFNLFSPSHAVVARDLLSNAQSRTDDCPAAPFSLSDIFRFDDAMKKELSEGGSGFKLLVQIGSDLVAQARNSFLLGCHLIMSHGLGFEEAFLSLRPLHVLLDRFSNECSISVEKSLRAFCCAKCLNWIDFRISANNDIQIDRFVHDVR
jgi:hypothetical protein